MLLKRTSGPAWNRNEAMAIAISSGTGFGERK